MRKYDYDFVNKIYADLSKRIDAFITICFVLEDDDIELYISTNNIIENIITTLGIKKGFFSSEDLNNITYFELISDLSFSSYLEELSIDMAFIHNIRKIINSQHDLSINNQYISKELLLKGILDVSVITNNALFSNKVSFASQEEIKDLLFGYQFSDGEKKANNNSIDISNEVLKKIFAKAIELLFSSNDIKEIISLSTQKEPNIQELPFLEEQIEEKQIDIKEDTDNKLVKPKKKKLKLSSTLIDDEKSITNTKQYRAYQRMLFLKAINEEKYSFDKVDAKINISNRKKELKNKIISEEVVPSDRKYLKTLERGCVFKGELSEIKKDLKNKYANMIRLAKERRMLAVGFPGTAYDSALWNKAYLKDSIYVCPNLLIPICSDITIVCNTDRSKKSDSFALFKIAVDLINKIGEATEEIKKLPPDSKKKAYKKSKHKKSKSKKNKK